MDAKDEKIVEALKKDSTKSKKVLVAGAAALQKLKQTRAALKKAKAEFKTEED